MRQRIILFLISTMPDREKFIRRLIKKYLPTKYIARKPVRPSKKTNGEAII